jgi:hypothetical protein
MLVFLVILSLVWLGVTAIVIAVCRAAARGDRVAEAPRESLPAMPRESLPLAPRDSLPSSASPAPVRTRIVASRRRGLAANR